MRIECKTFNMLDLTESEVSFFAEALYHEADHDFDSDYMALARNNFERALQLFRVLAHESEWYALRVKRCEEKLEEIEAQSKEK